jgi:hypothetical protein
MEDASAEHLHKSTLRLLPFAFRMNEQVLPSRTNRGTLVEQVCVPTFYQCDQALVMSESKQASRPGHFAAGFLERQFD